MTESMKSERGAIQKVLSLAGCGLRVLSDDVTAAESELAALEDGLLETGHQLEAERRARKAVMAENADLRAKLDAAKQDSERLVEAIWFSIRASTGGITIHDDTGDWLVVVVQGDDIIGQGTTVADALRDFVAKAEVDQELVKLARLAARVSADASKEDDRG